MKDNVIIWTKKATKKVFDSLKERKKKSIHLKLKGGYLEQREVPKAVLQQFIKKTHKCTFLVKSRQ